MFFLGPETGRDIAQRRGRADLVAANNVFAHVPDLVGFAAGLRALVKDNGLVTIEVPHLLRLIQRPPVRHDLPRALPVLHAAHRLEGARGRRPAVIDVEELSTHGGSMRIHARPADHAGEPTRGSSRCSTTRTPPGLHTFEGHAGFAGEVLRSSRDLVSFLFEAERDGKTVAGYGAPGKGNTLLNHCGIRTDLLASPSIAARTSRACSCRARTFRSIAPERIAEVEARLRAAAALEPARGALRAAGLRARVGRSAGRADSGARGFLAQTDIGGYHS